MAVLRLHRFARPAISDEGADWIISWLLWDATYSVLILTATGYSLYRWSASGFRWTIIELLAITGVVGGWLAIWRASPMYASPLSEPWFIQIPVAFGVGCLLFAAVMVVMLCVKRLLSEFTTNTRRANTE